MGTIFLEFLHIIMELSWLVYIKVSLARFIIDGSYLLSLINRLPHRVQKTWFSVSDRVWFSFTGRMLNDIFLFFKGQEFDYSLSSDIVHSGCFFLKDEVCSFHWYLLFFLKLILRFPPIVIFRIYFVSLFWLCFKSSSYRYIGSSLPIFCSYHLSKTTNNFFSLLLLLMFLYIAFSVCHYFLLSSVLFIHSHVLVKFHFWNDF